MNILFTFLGVSLNQSCQKNCQSSKKLIPCREIREPRSYACLENCRIQVFQQTTGGKSRTEVEPIGFCKSKENYVDCAEGVVHIKGHWHGQPVTLKYPFLD